jgi:hypothetical protein
VSESNRGQSSVEDVDFISLEAYRTAIHARNMEIGLFWQRSNYFLVLSTAIAVGFFSLKDEKFTLLLSIMGLVVAILWFFVNLGSKFWQSRWEQRVHVTEEELSKALDLFSANWDTIRQDVRASFGDRKRGPLRRMYEASVLAKPSVTLMMILLSLSFVLFWVAAISVYLTTRSW